MSALVEFFRGEGFSAFGHKGDYEGWSPEHTAIHFLREHLSCVVPFERPIEMILTCPACGERHIDEGEFADEPHHTHACQGCGMVWRPAKVPTIGVQFLPGLKNAAAADDTKQVRCHCGCLVSVDEIPCDAPHCVLASGTLTEGGDVEQAPSDSLSGPTGEAGDAQGPSA